MSTWRRKAQESFPQFAAEMETWERVELSSKLADVLASSVQTGDSEAIRSIVQYLAWCWSQKQSDEQFVYFVEYALQQALKRPADRSAFCSVIDSSSFAMILPIYATFHGAKEAEMLEREFRLRPKANKPLNARPRVRHAAH